jgi:hypothetical protein
MLCGCASFRAADLPAPLKASLPDICERILTPVEMPEVLGDDAIVAFMKDDAALIVANNRIAGGRACVRDMRDEYAGEGISR